ncbi:MAG: hypothetical protein ABL933_10795 [Methyloglobulus sp.]
MKTLLHKKTLITALAISAFANVPAALADIYFGPSVFLNTAGSATDVYALSCPIGTAKVIAEVGNKTGGIAESISMQVIVPNGRALNANALENSNTLTRMTGAGAGNYLITVHKSFSNAVEPYDINMDCFDKNEIAFSGTQSALVQNQ